MNRWQLALAGLVLFATGGMIGAMFGKKPPPPVAVASLQQQDATFSDMARHEEAALEKVNVLQVLPPVKETKWVRKYLPAPNCQPVLVEESGTTTDTGTGSIAISSDRASGSVDEQKKEGQIKTVIQRVEVPVKMDLPRLTIGPGVGVKPGDDKKIVTALAVDLRITDDDYLSLVLSAPPTDIKEDFTAMLFLKLGAWK